MNHRYPALLSILLPAAALAAQRVDANFDWQKNQVVVSYGAVRVGTHKLSELPVGGDWRMGNNEASTLHTDLPLVSDQGIVAPGSYRVGIKRSEERTLGLTVAGAELVTGGAPYFASPLSEDAKDEVDKLEVAFASAGKGKKAGKKVVPASDAGDGDNQETEAQASPFDDKHAKTATLELAFGAYRLAMPIGVVGGKAEKVKGFEAQSFTWPAELFQAHLGKGHALPVLGLRVKGGSKSRPKSFNLMVTEKKAEMTPAMIAPTDSFGFGQPKAPAAGEVLAGTIEWSDAQGEKPVLEVDGLGAKKKDLVLTITVGKKTAKITVPMPSAK